VIDPSQKIDGVRDVAFTGGKVAAVGKDLKPGAGTEIRDVSGYIVTPGLIDLHTHVYWGGTSLGIDAEEFCRTSGVTTAIDTGSAGPGNWMGFRKHVIEKSQVRILAYLHVSHAGIYGFDKKVMVGESREIDHAEPGDCARSPTRTATSSSASRCASAATPPAPTARRRSTWRCRWRTRWACR
jgi:dihydroorotase